MGAGIKENSTHSPQSPVLGAPLLQAALFLEIARELDEKELEIQSGYARLNSIEREFRDILGIENDESGRAETNLTPALAPDTNGLLYMLPKRIESWFRLFAIKPVENMPVFVACFPEVIEETLEIIRTWCERDEKEFSAANYLLGSIAGLDGLGAKQFRSLIEAPGMSELLSSYQHDLEKVITSAAGGGKAAELEEKSLLVQSSFDKFCRNAQMPEENTINLRLTVVQNVLLTEVPGLSGLSRGFGAAGWPPVFLSIAAA